MIRWCGVVSICTLYTTSIGNPSRMNQKHFTNELWNRQMMSIIQENPMFRFHVSESSYVGSGPLVMKYRYSGVGWETKHTITIGWVNWKIDITNLESLKESHAWSFRNRHYSGMLSYWLQIWKPENISNKCSNSLSLWNMQETIQIIETIQMVIGHVATALISPFSGICKTQT